MKSTKSLAHHLVIVSVLAIVGMILLHQSLLFGFLFAILYSIVMLNYYGYDVRSLIRSAFSETIEYRWLYVTIILIGATVAIWLSSGTIATMVFYGLNYIEGINFVLFTFWIVSICSFFMGTAVGTFSTIGIILFSIGSIIGIPPALLIGSIVSGAFVADKLSAISGLVNINLKLCEVNYRDVLLPALATLLPTMLITSLIYYFLGNEFVMKHGLSNLVHIQSELQSSFVIHPVLFVLPILILLLSVFGINSLYTILSGIGLGSLFSLFVQKKSLTDVIRHLLFGYSSSNEGELAHILKGGGMLKMFEVALIVASAIFLVNLLIKSSLIDKLIQRFAQSIHSPRQLLFRTACLSIGTTALTCDQTLGLVLPASLLKKSYDEFGIRREVLFRTLSDTGLIVAPIFPWNINYLIIVGIIGSGIYFIPYACLCYISPVVSLTVGMIRKKS